MSENFRQRLHNAFDSTPLPNLRERAEAGLSARSTSTADPDVRPWRVLAAVAVAVSMIATFVVVSTQMRRAVQPVPRVPGIAASPWLRVTSAPTAAPSSEPGQAPAVPGTPQVDTGISLAYDGALRKVVMLGGTRGARTMETWIFDGKSWSRSTGSEPGFTYHYSLAYDPVQRQLVAFGANAAMTDCGASSTWTWDGRNWTQHTASGQTPGPYGAMAFSSALNKVLYFGGGGCGAQYGAETWTWDGKAWTQLHPGGSGPSAPTYYDSVGTMGVDADGNAMYLDGHVNNAPAHLWRFVGGAWTFVQPVGSGLPSGGTAVALAPARWFVFGTSGVSESWTFDGQAWAYHGPPNIAPVAGRWSGAYDPDSGTVVMFGGPMIGGSQFQTWVWDGKGWTSAAGG